ERMQPTVGVVELPYSRRIDELRSAVENTFGPKWLSAARVTNLLQQVWPGRDPWDSIAVCRVGRDIARLRARGDAEQDARLDEIVARQIKPLARAADFLYELHVAMLFDERRGSTGKLALPGAPGYDLSVGLSRGRTVWVSCKRLDLSKQERT